MRALGLPERPVLGVARGRGDVPDALAGDASDDAQPDQQFGSGSERDGRGQSGFPRVVGVSRAHQMARSV